MDKTKLRRLFNKDYSMKYHNEFFFIRLSSDNSKMYNLKKNLFGRKFKSIGTKITDAHEKPWKKKPTKATDTIICTETREIFSFNRSTLFNMKPAIDITKNPRWDK